MSEFSLLHLRPGDALVITAPWDASSEDEVQEMVTRIRDQLPGFPVLGVIGVDGLGTLSREQIRELLDEA